MNRLPPLSALRLGALAAGLLSGPCGFAQSDLTPAAIARLPCSTLLSLIDDETFNVPAAVTMRMLVDRVGRERLRPLLGFTAKDRSDPLFDVQAAAALRILTAYDRRYCADHPLDTLQQVVDSLVAQIPSAQ